MNENKETWIDFEIFIRNLIRNLINQVLNIYNNIENTTLLYIYKTYTINYFI